MGVDRRRCSVWLDPNARRAGGGRAAGHRAHHPHDRARSRAVGRRCGGGDPAGLGERLRTRRLVEAARRLATRHRDRIPARRHAAHSQGDDRLRPERKGRDPEIQRRDGCAPSQCRSRRTADGPGRTQRRDSPLSKATCRVMPNFNRANLSLEPVNVAINDALERAAVTSAELPRPYLGASIVGHECARRIQYDWWCKPVLAARTREIFARGHDFEERSRRQLAEAGFKFAPPELCAFSALGGTLRGHADGIIIDGPQLPGLCLICPAIWECKAVNAKNWRALERDGLEKVFPHYAAQVALYQAYLDVTNPALFTATNADTCERLHFLVPFNSERAQGWSDRAANIIEATRAGELLPRGFDDPEDWRCRMCAHHARCWG